ncbi:MAG: peptidylprolyl isomerase [Thermodesulfobacteriota bacterium]
MRLLRRLGRSRLVHFVLLGGALFAARELSAARQGREPGAAVREPIVVSRERVRALEEGFVAQWGVPPTEAQRRALVEQAVLDEMLFREARVLALGFGDRSVRRRLVEKMRTVSERPARDEDQLVRDAIELGLDDDVVIRRLLVEKMRLVLGRGAGPTAVRDGDLAAHLARHADEYRLPERISLTHVFLSADLRGARLDGDARRALAELRAPGAAPERVTALSDPFPLGHELRAYSAAQLLGRFGEAFAEQVAALEPGAWSGPLASPYGLHLVRVDRKEPARLASVDEVRPALTRAVLRERARDGFARGVAALRSLYEVRVEDQALHAAGGARGEARS